MILIFAFLTGDSFCIKKIYFCNVQGLISKLRNVDIANMRNICECIILTQSAL